MTRHDGPIAPPSLPSAPHALRASEVLDRFLRDAGRQGERAVAGVRAGAALVLVSAAVGLQWHDIAAPWVAVPIFAAVVAGLYGAWELARPAAPALQKYRSLVGPLADWLPVFTILLRGVLWPHENYAGALRQPEVMYLAICAIAAGVRLHVGAAIFGPLVSVAGLLWLVRVEFALNPERVNYSTFDYLYVAVGMGLSTVLGITFARRTRRLVRQGAESVLVSERARQTLGVYVSEEVASEALSSEAGLVRGGKNARAAVLFSDLRGFTSYAERVSAAQVVEELNLYLDDMVGEIKRHGGMVDKFIGDAIMAVFVKGDDDAPALSALRAAVAMNQALARHNERRAQRQLPPLAQGVGVHFGDVVMGNIGSQDRMQYTVIGDTVNLASRIESSTKELGSALLCSEATVEAARRALAASGADEPAIAHATFVDELKVKGREQAVRLWTVPGP